MRIVIQRVKRAAVYVDGRRVSSIEKGLMVLVGVEEGDTDDDMRWLADKTAALRIFPDAEGVMNRSVKDADGRILAVSQFTLTASTRKGNRPSYIRAARHELATRLYDAYADRLTDLLGHSTRKGIFGADMQIDMLADGPVTIIIDSRLRE